MRDFTFQAYKKYLEAIKLQNIPFYQFRDFLSFKEKPAEFCLLRHDVDRKPGKALKMAIAEAEMEIKTTYYFRAKKHTFKKDIIQRIENLGHEIGYHYESLSDSNGNIKDAIADFEKNLAKFRKISETDTCAMHGRPFKPYDNRDIWRNKTNHDRLTDVLKIKGEAYLDIDYTDILYINDTGRNWSNKKANMRDKVTSEVSIDFKTGSELLKYLSETPHKKICFQIHPERWSDNYLEYFIVLLTDTAINAVKAIISLMRKQKT